MSVSPYVKFNFENNNVVETTPLMGVSCILTRTTKGPFNDPSKVIQSYAQFQREFGEEIMEDGSVSNVQKALELGSKLRIVRILYGEDLEEGTIDEAGSADLITAGDYKLSTNAKLNPEYENLGWSTRIYNDSDGQSREQQLTGTNNDVAVSLKDGEVISISYDNTDYGSSSDDAKLIFTKL